MTEAIDHDTGENNEDGSPVVAALEAINPNEARAELDTKQNVDPRAGIIIAKLDNFNPVPDPEQSNSPYEFYAARVMPGGHVNPHHHNVGSEPYHFLSGAGEMNIGKVEANSIAWETPRQVQPGETFTVQAGEVHSLRNPDPNAPLDFLFACPPEHLVDNGPENPEGDRYFTDNLPTHY